MKFIIKFLYGVRIVGEVEGLKEINENEITVGDVQRLLETEKFLEAITGLRVHIDYEMPKVRK